MLDGIPPAPRGMPQVEVTFDIDANGILNVSAKDKASGKSQSVRIEASTGMSKEEVERLKQEAAAQADTDKQKRALAEAHNNAEQIIYLSEKSLREAGDKVPTDVKDAITKKIEAVKAVKDGTDASKIEQAVQELSTEIQKIGSAMYGKSNDAKGEPGPTEGQPNQGQ
jgi:molecular chaperone DnaK